MNQYHKYLLKKFWWYLLTFFIAISLNFFLPRLIKGNPVDAIVAKMTQGMTDRDQIKEFYVTFAKEFGTDKPLLAQYLIYLEKLAHGDLGTSFSVYPRSVGSLLQSAIPWTVALQLPAILIGWLLGNLLGAYSAYKKGIFDKVIFPLSLLLNSMPFFALSIIYLYVFAVSLRWFPLGGGYSYTLVPNLNLEFIGSVLQHHLLPFLSIMTVTIGGQAIGMREMAIYELNSDYVLNSKLLGIKDRKVIHYVFRNAMLPQITGLALQIGLMVSGALVTELVFNYPGIGSLLFTAIRQLDYPLISGCTLMITLTVLLANFIIEIIYGLADPRIKTAQLEEA